MSPLVNRVRTAHASRTKSPGNANLPPKHQRILCRSGRLLLGEERNDANMVEYRSPDVERGHKQCWGKVGRWAVPCALALTGQLIPVVRKRDMIDEPCRPLHHTWTPLEIYRYLQRISTRLGSLLSIEIPAETETDTRQRLRQSTIASDERRAPATNATRDVSRRLHAQPRAGRRAGGRECRARMASHRPSPNTAAAGAS